MSQTGCSNLTLAFGTHEGNPCPRHRGMGGGKGIEGGIRSRRRARKKCPSLGSGTRAGVQMSRTWVPKARRSENSGCWKENKKKKKLKEGQGKGPNAQTTANPHGERPCMTKTYWLRKKRDKTLRVGEESYTARSLIQGKRTVS